MTQASVASRKGSSGSIDDGERALIISSDGHASAQMDDYRPYLPSQYHEEFDAFCEEYRLKGSRNFEPKNLLAKTDPDVVDDWVKNVMEAGRLEGLSDPQRRLTELGREGVSAEVLFPDFGLPFELYSPLLAAKFGATRSPEQIEVANRAYNRWLADFCQSAPERFAGLAVVSFDDVEAAVEEIRWVKDAGLRGIVLPMFPESAPIFDEGYEPIWNVLEELGMPVNSHIAISAITRHVPVEMIARLPHPACALPIFNAHAFFGCHQILTHLIWGGVLERHPDLQVVFTEQGSGWVISALTAMDYSYEGSYLRRDIREIVRRKPSEYFDRQCHLGSSLFSLSEAKARHQIGIDKIAIGVDYPHLEGTWGAGPGTFEWLRATLGAAEVPPDEARLMLGGNAARLWNFDTAALEPIAQRVGPVLQDILTPPVEDRYPRGDVNKPLI